MTFPANPPGEIIATESRPPEGPPCPRCGLPVPPQKMRRGLPKVYCTERCQKRAWHETHPRVGQRVIDWNPPPEPEPIEHESQKALRRELRRRLTRKEALLRRLREGPATRSEVKAIGGDRFSARIDQLRDDGHRIVGPRESPKHGITETTKPAAGGGDVYELVEASS